MVKMKVVDAGMKETEAHLKYITREGVGKDGGSPVTYGEGTLEIEPGKVGHQIRCLLLPKGGVPELRPLVESAVAEMQRHTGKKLNWVAVEHHNAKHPHAHLVAMSAETHQEM